MPIVSDKSAVSRNIQRLFWSLSVTICTLGVNAIAQPKTDKLLDELLHKSPELFGPVLKNPAKYDVQVLYTQIDRDAQNRPSFRTYRYRIDKNRYFYPASTVKFPSVLLSLEKLNGLKISREATMLTDSAYAGQTSVRRDTSARNGMPSVAQYARKILLVSDNDAFNRLYEFVGQCDMNERLYNKGYQHLRIVHRLEIALPPDQNRRTNPIRFLDNTNKLIYQQPEQVCDRTPKADSVIRRGTGYMKGGSLVNEPFDFTGKNYFALEDQQAILKAVLFPDEVTPKQRFNLTPDDYRFLYQYLSERPRESVWPHYDSTHYDSYCKFLFAGDTKTPMPRHIRIFNKVGDAYGYLIDNAYMVDFDKGIEFMLSAVIYCNEDGILNDGKYDYDTIGMPFMGNLGRVIYDYETTRNRPNKPDLSRFKLSYE